MTILPRVIELVIALFIALFAYPRRLRAEAVKRNQQREIQWWEIQGEDLNSTLSNINLSNRIYFSYLRVPYHLSVCTLGSIRAQSPALGNII